MKPLLIRSALLGLVGVMGCLAGCHGEVSTPKSGKGVVIVDIRRIVEARVKSLERDVSSGKQFDPKEVRMMGTRLAADVFRLVQVYADKHGVMVINGDQIVGLPEGSDITAEIAAKVGVKVEPRKSLSQVIK